LHVEGTFLLEERAAGSSVYLVGCVQTNTEETVIFIVTPLETMDVTNVQQFI
jgi:hypothetical protein